MKFARSLIISTFLLLSSCNDTASPNAIRSSKNIPEHAHTEIPNCVLDVNPGKIKKCKPELELKTFGLSGEIRLDGIRPGRKWTPMSAIELISADENSVLRIKFSISEYKKEKNGKVLLAETPFNGAIELWRSKTLVWSQEIPIELLPLKALDFKLVWEQPGQVNIALDGERWDVTTQDFEVTSVNIIGSGVRASTASLVLLSYAD